MKNRSLADATEVWILRRRPRSTPRHRPRQAATVLSKRGILLVLCIALASSLLAAGLRLEEGSSADVGVFTIWGANAAALVAGLTTVLSLRSADSRRGRILAGIVIVQIVVGVVALAWPYRAAASDIPRSEAEQFIVELVDRLGPSLLPDGRWHSNPIGSEDGPQTTGCGDGLGDTDVVTVPYEAESLAGTASDEATIDLILSKAATLLRAEGFSVERSDEGDRVGGSNDDGYFAAVLVSPARQAFNVFASTPCVRVD